MVSVIIPCYNSENFIARAIESVLKQTYAAYEIILVDNGSADGTMRILHEYEEKYPSLIRVLQEGKKGAPAARNKGLYAAKGSWLQFLDSDDELLPEKLQSQIDIAEKSDGNLVIGDCCLYVKINGKIFKKPRIIESQNIWKGLIMSRLGRTSSMLWRKQAVIEAGGWDESKTSSQEYNLLFRMLKLDEKAAFCNLPQTIIHINENSIHLSTDNRKAIEIANNHIRLRLEIEEYLKSKNKLSPVLDYTVNAHNYSYLMNLKETLPEYVHEKLKEIRFRLPVSFFLKRYIRIVKYATTEYARIVFNIGRQT